MNPAAISACPTCGEQSAESYGLRGLCWHCFDGNDAKAATLPKLAAVEPIGSTSQNCATPAGAPTQNGRRAYAVGFTDTKPPKLVLPAIPAHDDLPALLAWTTSVLRLNPAHPVTRVTHQGRRGQDGHIELRRAGAPAIYFEPASAVNSARRLLPALGWQLHPTDGEPYGFKDEHCHRIARVLQLACGVCKAPDAATEAAGIVGTFTMYAEAVEGHTTYGESGQRHEAAEAMRSTIMAPPRYLIDENTGELVVRVSDLQDAARKHVGSSLPHGWLDARMEQLGWTRAQLQGYAQSGRDGRKGPHSRCDIYRGHLPADETDTEQAA